MVSLYWAVSFSFQTYIAQVDIGLYSGGEWTRVNRNDTKDPFHLWKKYSFEVWMNFLWSLLITRPHHGNRYFPGAFIVEWGSGCLWELAGFWLTQTRCGLEVAVADEFGWEEGETQREVGFVSKKIGLELPRLMQILQGRGDVHSPAHSHSETMNIHKG